jgi:nucleoside-diphosphate-sugar epimerase
MRIFVAGATSSVGRRLIPALVEQGHEVTGMTRSRTKSGAIEATGARPVVADVFDRASVLAALGAASPEVVVHQLSALTPGFKMRTFARHFEVTNQLRREGTANIVAGAKAAGTARMVAQSFVGWTLARVGGPVKTEDDAFDPQPPSGFRDAVEAIRTCESEVLGADEFEGVNLRYGLMYGPGTLVGEGGPLLEDVRRRRMPIVGDGNAVWSFVHIDDAITATVKAIEEAPAGTYNIVDDDPAPVAEWLPALAAAIHAPPPKKVPVWLARIAVGKHGVIAMTDLRGASNAKAKNVLGWQLRFPSWREGFTTLTSSNRSSPTAGVTPPS